MSSVAARWPCDLSPTFAARQQEAAGIGKDGWPRRMFSQRSSSPSHSCFKADSGGQRGGGHPRHGGQTLPGHERRRPTVQLGEWPGTPQDVSCRISGDWSDHRGGPSSPTPSRRWRMSVISWRGWRRTTTTPTCLRSTRTSAGTWPWRRTGSPNWAPGLTSDRRPYSSYPGCSETAPSDTGLNQASRTKAFLQPVGEAALAGCYRM